MRNAARLFDIKGNIAIVATREKHDFGLVQLYA
jgi:hypothetical protein